MITAKLLSWLVPVVAVCIMRGDALFSASDEQNCLLSRESTRYHTVEAFYATLKGILQRHEGENGPFEVVQTGKSSGGNVVTVIKVSC